MAIAKQLCFCLLAFVLPLVAVAKPAGGKVSFNDIHLDAVQKRPEIVYQTGVCKEIGLYNGSTIYIHGFYQGEGNTDVNVTFYIQVRLFKAMCANTIGDEIPEEGCDFKLENSDKMTLVAENRSPLMSAVTGKQKLYINENKTVYFFNEPATESPPKPPSGEGNGTSPTVNGTPAVANAGSSGESGSKTKRSAPSTAPIPFEPRNTTESGQNKTVFRIRDGSAMYIVQLLFIKDIEHQDPKKNGSLNVSITLEMRNPHGFLSAVDYPALVFYGVMTGIYTIFAFAWFIMMACSYKDLVRLQFWVLAVILLGFFEKMLFVSEYGSINVGNESSGIIMIAELVSAVKRALSRMLLIIVAMGFGTVKPRLGDSLGKVVAIGVVYTVLAVMDGIIRARNETFVSRDAASTVTLALLLIFDSFVMYWIFTAIVDTRRTLRLRKNYVKLAMYNHFAYTLIFAIVASLGFIVWELVTLNFPAGNCLTDWKEVWLRDCFWHVLFAFILLIVMVIWRPSANRNRFAYSLVNDEDDIDEEEPEQGPNKNFDTVKMRQMTKSESEVPPVTSQAEDDLRWVEENLPTTAMDKALPLILDSDEEVMTTKFEISKMD